MPPELVVTLAAVTVPPIVVVPVLLRATAPSAPPVAEPTAPVSVTAPDPALTVRALASLASESIAPPKLTALFVVAMVTAPSSWATP